MRFKRETIEIEGGRKLYRYIFDESSGNASAEVEDGKEADASDSNKAQEEPKGTSDEQGGR